MSSTNLAQEREKYFKTKNVWEKKNIKQYIFILNQLNAHHDVNMM